MQIQQVNQGSGHTVLNVTLMLGLDTLAVLALRGISSLLDGLAPPMPPSSSPLPLPPPLCFLLA